MDLQQILLITTIGLCVFLVIRFIFLTMLVQSIRKKVFERIYERVLTSPEFQVKGKYEQ